MEKMGQKQEINREVKVIGKKKEKIGNTYGKNRETHRDKNRGTIGKSQRKHRETIGKQQGKHGGPCWDVLFGRGNKSARAWIGTALPPYPGTCIEV